MNQVNQGSDKNKKQKLNNLFMGLFGSQNDQTQFTGVPPVGMPVPPSMPLPVETNCNLSLQQQPVQPPMQASSVPMSQTTALSSGAALQYPQNFEQLPFLDKVLSLMVANNASDCYPVVGYRLALKVSGHIVHDERMPELNSEDVKGVILAMMNKVQIETFTNDLEVDFAFAWQGHRFRVNAFHQMNKPSLTIRYLRNDINSLAKLGLPPVIAKLAELNSGIILLCGVTGSGKSTTLAAMVDHINEGFSKHIITIEDPVEYTYEKKKSIIEQREVGTDTKTFASAMKSALRQNPNVLLLGEMRDLESIASAITIAESGHLVLATIHARNSVQCINKIIDAFPSDQQSQIRTQLSEALAAIITQKLIPGTDGKQKLVMEIMTNNSAIANMIREAQTHQIESVIQTSKADGMQLLDEHILARLRAGEITQENAILYANKPQDITNNI